MKFAKKCRSAEALCEEVVERVGRPIQLQEFWDLPQGYPGMTVETPTHFIISYRPLSDLSIQFTILHELVHIVFGEVEKVGTVLRHDALDGKWVDTETEIEDFAYQLLVAIHGIEAFVSERKNPPVAADYERMVSGRET